MKTQLLRESLDHSESRMITEAKGNNVYLQGIFMQAAVKNRNGRTYSLDEMVGAVSDANAIIKEHGGIFGELDHPDTIQINMDRISHVIKELHVNNQDVYGKAQILKTPMGMIAEELSRSGCRYGISSRGAGMVNEGGAVTGYKFITADLVATPSAPSAYPESIYEGLESTKSGKKVLTLAEAMKEDDSAQKYFQKEILKFVDDFFNKL